MDSEKTGKWTRQSDRPGETFTFRAFSRHDHPPKLTGHARRAVIREAAEIYSSGGIICPQDNCYSCTPQIGPLWKSGKKRAIVETKPCSLPQAMWGMQHTCGGRATVEWFRSKDIYVVVQPSQSPDLNPIQNLWQDWEISVHGHSPSSQTKLELFCKEE